jgi:hypothetical protein
VIGLFCSQLSLEMAWLGLKIGQLAPIFCKCALLSPFNPIVKSPDPQPPPYDPSF